MKNYIPNNGGYAIIHLNMKENLMTQRELELKMQSERICKDFRKLRQQNPEASNHRLFTALAHIYKKTVPGIRHILITAGEYQTNNKLTH